MRIESSKCNQYPQQLESNSYRHSNYILLYGDLINLTVFCRLLRLRSILAVHLSLAIAPYFDRSVLFLTASKYNLVSLYNRH